MPVGDDAPAIDHEAGADLHAGIGATTVADLHRELPDHALLGLRFDRQRATVGERIGIRRRGDATSHQGEPDQEQGEPLHSPAISSWSTAFELRALAHTSLTFMAKLDDSEKS